MNIAMDWGVLNINVPRTEMLLIQTNPVEIRQLDLTEFRYAMHDKQDDPEGMPFLHMHEHNPPTTVAGVTLAQVVTIVNDYTVTFEDGLYNVNIVGGNSNVADNVVKNQVGVNTANSAGLQNLDTLLSSAYSGEVVIDVINGQDGTVIPLGTRSTPVRTIPDAREIMTKQNVNELVPIGDITIGLGDDVRGIHMRGASHINNSLLVEPDALCLSTQFSSFEITGTLDGNSEIKDCIVRELTYLDGHVHNSSLVGRITLSGVALASFYDCSMYDITDPPIIDCGDSGQDVVITKFSGLIEIDNLTGSSTIAIGMDAGELVINPTCTSGTIIISGAGGLIDNSGDGCYVVNRMLDGTKLDNIQTTIEFLRPNHTGTGNIWYWNPYSGDDTWDGQHKDRGFKTFAKAHDSAFESNHDTIICVPANPNGVTTVDENLVVTKNYLFVRGPGRDFEIKTVNDLLDTISISGDGVEISGVKVANSSTNTKHAIYSSGNFTLVKNVYIHNSGNGVNFENSNYAIAEDLKSHHNTGYGIKISGTSEHVDIANCHIGGNTKSGVVIDTVNGHEVNIKNGTVIHNNAEYGVDISNTSEGVIIESTVQIFNNTLGDVNDLGVGTHIATIAGGATPQDIWGYTTRTLTEGSGGGLTGEQAALIDRTAYIEAKVFVDTELIEVGDGSQSSPFNDFATAKDYAEANGIYKLVVHGECTISGVFKNFIVEGLGTALIHTNGQNLHNSKFYQCTMEGEYTGTIIVQESVISGGFILDGFIEKSMFLGDMTCRDGSVTLLAGCFSGIAGLNRPTISMNGAGSSKLSIRNYSGGLTINDCNNSNDEITVEVSQGSLTFTNTCTAGVMVARGLCKFVDNSNGATVVDETSYNSINDIQRLLDYNEGTWKIINNQMIYYDRSDVAFLTFDLKDISGQPVTRGATQRVKV